LKLKALTRLAALAGASLALAMPSAGCLRNISQDANSGKDAKYKGAKKLELDDSGAGELWRNEYLYSRAATIYGGSAEVQRNIIARRLLDLGDEA